MPKIPPAAALMVSTDGRSRACVVSFFRCPDRERASCAAFDAIGLTSNGSLVVSGGAASAVMLTRGRTTINMGTVAGHFPASGGDRLKITYSAAPTVSFCRAK